MHWRHIKIRNPLRQRTLTFRETLLAKEAEEKKAAEKESKKLERERRISLARLEGREGIWPRLKRFVRSLAPTDFWEKLPVEVVEAAGQAAEGYESEEEAEEQVVVEESWEGNWEAALEESEGED
ncbi:Nn.00g097000.m01.CDS01 [Neocucurbitaria sp. VM-36]